MAGKAVSIERSDNIAIVRLDRGGKANAMSFAIMDELADAALSFVDDTPLRAIVLTGTDRIFSAGMDLTDPFFDRLPDVPLEEVRYYSERGPRLARAWTQIEVPVICAVEGACMGGGLALAATADSPSLGAFYKCFGRLRLLWAIGPFQTRREAAWPARR